MTEFCEGEKPTYQNCVEEPSPPDAVGMKSAFALQLAPQDHAKVLAGWQYAALAKNENGLNEAICAVDKVLMAWRANKEVSSVGAAETTVATKTMD